MDSTKLLIRKILIIAGLLFIALAIAIGVCIIIFSFKFMGGIWLTWWQYMLAMLGLGIAAMIIAVLGIFVIYLSIDNNNNN